MNHAAEFRRCLEECDVVAVRKLWQHIAPNAPQPASDFEALATIHRARTESMWASLSLRAYSHRWLLDHELPSALPDELRPKAERMYPRIVEGVGISVNTNSEILKPIVGEIRQAMSDAVMESYADGTTDPTYVKSRMMAAKTITINKLFGRKAL